MSTLTRCFWPSGAFLQICMCKLYKQMFKFFACFVIYHDILTSLGKSCPLKTFLWPKNFIIRNKFFKSCHYI
jgi:hypothetical protein